MYCRTCGTELTNGENYCPKCGTLIGIIPVPGVVPPPLMTGIANPNMMFRSVEAKVFGIVSSFTIGLGIISGGIYGIVVLTQYTQWVLLGSIFTILGGIGCLALGGSLIARLIRQKQQQNGGQKMGC